MGSRRFYVKVCPINSKEMSKVDLDEMDAGA